MCNFWLDIFRVINTLANVLVEIELIPRSRDAGSETPVLLATVHPILLLQILRWHRPFRTVRFKLFRYPVELGV